MIAAHDERDTMSPERRREVARELGLDDLPNPRYDDLPEIHNTPAIQERWNHMKAVSCVDPLATAAFMNYLPDRLVIDQSMNARDFKRGWSYAIYLDTQQPIPVNRKITAATGIGRERNEKNWYGWLAQWCMRAYEELGARAMAPPLLWRTRGEKVGGRWAIRPLLGLIIKLDRTAPDGLRIEDMAGQVGILHPGGETARNRVLPVALATMEGEHNPGKTSLTSDALASGARLENRQ